MNSINTLEYINAVLSGFVSQLIFSLIGAAIAVFLENNYGLLGKFIILKHKLLNSEVRVQLLVVYSSNMLFENLKNIVLVNLKDKYGKIRVYKDNEQKLEVMVDDSFHINVDTLPENQFSFQTNKITSHMNSTIQTVDKILNVFKDIKRDVKSASCEHEDKCFTVYLYLPYEKVYTKFNPPKNIDINNYELKMFCKEHSSEVILNRRFLKIDSKQRDDLLEVIKSFLKIG